MRIAYIIPKLVNQGPVIVVKDIITHIIDKVDLIHVYYFDELKEIDLPCQCFKIKFQQIIEFDKYDVIHSHMLRPDLYIWSKRKYINQAKCISTLHQDIYQNLKASYGVIKAIIFEKIWLNALKKQDIIITLTNSMSLEYASKFKHQKLKTIYNGRGININRSDIEIELGDLLKINQLKKSFKIIGLSALLTKRKGISQIINSLPYLNDYALIVVGDGIEMQNLVKLAERKGVATRCLFLGYKIDAYRYLPYFDLYAMSSYSEGFPLGLLEAACYKLPILCSDIPLFRELFSDTEVSFFELDNTKSIVSAIHKLYSEKKEFARNVYEKVMSTYSVDEMAMNYLNLYIDITKKC